ncbi:hypothetical protein CPB85DRAFT_1226344 [Mucidula mucida]|nr:hypothetical protein CPB85DRAFT_1226344 [Mucidula mucida]
MILEEERDHELKVTFYPPLYLQRKIWVLDVMRREGIVDVVDIGCGEGQLLSALCQPAPWLGPPPPGIIPPSTSDIEPSTPTSPTSPNFNSASDPIPNLHPHKIAGLDISERDLQFAIDAVSPPMESPVVNSYMTAPVRWEPLVATIWKGGLQVINEEFVNTECIVSSEVIEHLSPDILPFFAPMLLGVYHPYKLLITTPSYTFNARFTSPNAPPSVRQGFPDPTGRTDRIFRHHDHKFEWTVDEFKDWCTSAAEKWGYNVAMSDIGRANEDDEWGRDEQLGGASLVAEFTRKDVGEHRRTALEDEARSIVQSNAPPHERLSVQEHLAHPKARQPASFEKIATAVKQHMETIREAFLSFEMIWYDRDISILCGGWTEVLAKAVECSEDLDLKRDEAYKDQPERDAWMIELIGAPSQPRMLWPTTEDMGDHSFEFMEPDWIPVEEEYSDSSSSEGGGDEWGESTGAEEGDISWNNSEDERDGAQAFISRRRGWRMRRMGDGGKWR